MDKIYVNIKQKNCTVVFIKLKVGMNCIGWHFQILTGLKM